MNKGVVLEASIAFEQGIYFSAENIKFIQVHPAKIIQMKLKVWVFLIAKGLVPVSFRVAKALGIAARLLTATKSKLFNLGLLA